MLCITVNDLLNPLVKDNIDVVILEDKEVSFSHMTMYHGNKSVQQYKIVAKYKTLKSDDIKTTILSNDLDDIEECINLEYYLPGEAQYISIELHIKLKEDLLCEK